MSTRSFFVVSRIRSTWAADGWSRDGNAAFLGDKMEETMWNAVSAGK